MKEQTNIKPGEVKTSSYGVETCTIRVSDKGCVVLTYDEELGRLRMAVASYGPNPIELLQFGKESLEVKL